MALPAGWVPPEGISIVVLADPIEGSTWSGCVWAAESGRRGDGRQVRRRATIGRQAAWRKPPAATPATVAAVAEVSGSLRLGPSEGLTGQKTGRRTRDRGAARWEGRIRDGAPQGRVRGSRRAAGSLPLRLILRLRRGARRRRGGAGPTFGDLDGLPAPQIVDLQTWPKPEVWDEAMGRNGPSPSRSSTDYTPGWGHHTRPFHGPF